MNSLPNGRSSSHFLLIVILLLCTCISSSTAQKDGNPQEEQQTELVDWFGNPLPLPAGALQRFGSHSVFVVDFSPDGTTLASGNRDNTIKLWETNTGKEIATLSGHSVFTIDFSPDGTTLASGNAETITLWNVKTKKEIATLSGHKKSVYSVAFSPDGTILASSSWDKTVKLWNVETKKEIATLSGHESSVKSVAFSPDKNLLASGSYDKIIKLWDTATGKSVHTFAAESRVHDLEFSPSGNILASGSFDKTIKLWDVKTGKKIKTFSGHKNGVRSVAFSPDGSLLASGSDDNTIKLWNVKTGKEVKTFSGHKDGFDSGIRSVVFSPEGNAIASSSKNGSIIVWSLDPREWGIKLPIDDPENISEKQLWNTMSYKQPIATYQAMFLLANRGENAVSFLRKKINRLFNWEEKEKKKFNKLIEQLGATNFQKREQATKHLFGWLADIPGGQFVRLEERIKQEDDPEAKLRLRFISERLRKAYRQNDERLRLFRTIQVLEKIGGETARNLLKNIADQMGNYLVGRRASATLKRLKMESQ